MKTILILGATGTLGAYISLHFHKIGYRVIAVGHRKDDNGFFRGDRGGEIHLGERQADFPQTGGQYQQVFDLAGKTRRQTFGAFGTRPDINLGFCP